MKRFLFLLLFLPSLSFGQNFGTDGTLKYVQKSVTASTPAHEYFQLYNFSGDSLPMRWRVVDSLTFYPSQWEIALQDNITYHNPMIDSSDFILPDTVGAMDKIIINATPNGTIGYGEIVIELINLDSLPEKIRVTFQIEIIPATGIDQAINDDQNFLSLFPNPSQNFLTISCEKETQEFTIYNLIGEVVITQKVSGTVFSVSTEGLSAGTYILEVFSRNSSHFSKFHKQ